MSIEEALEEIKWFLDYQEREYDLHYVGDAAIGLTDSLEVLVEYVKAVRPVPTKRDQQAEMDKWDDFIHEGREKVSGISNA